MERGGVFYIWGIFFLEGGGTISQNSNKPYLDMYSFTVMKNHISSAVSEIFVRTDRQKFIEFQLLKYKKIHTPYKQGRSVVAKLFEMITYSLGKALIK